MRANAFCKLSLLERFLSDEQGIREGLILVRLARCIAMVCKAFAGALVSRALIEDQVLVWTGLAWGDNIYCAILVGNNSILQIVLYANLAVLFIRVISRSDEATSGSYSTVATSVAVFLGIPLGAAIITRLAIRKLPSLWCYDDKFL